MTLLRLLLATTLVTSLGLSAVSHSADSFNILLYHHISSTAPRSTSLSAEEFEEHLQYLKDK
nr:hypothetical protein [Oceanospirillaceae bacterium]